MSTESTIPHKSDLELATDIGRGLLSEINRMRATLQEKQQELKTLEAEKWENEQKVHELYEQLAHKTEIEERNKEDISNLDSTRQNLSFQISQLKTTIQKLQSEHLVQQNKEGLMQRELEALKAAQKNLQSMTIRDQIKNETIIFELNRSLEKLKAENLELLQLVSSSSSLAGSARENSQLSSLMREAQDAIKNAQQKNLDSSCAEASCSSHDGIARIEQEVSRQPPLAKIDQGETKETQSEPFGVTDQDVSDNLDDDIVKEYLPPLSLTMVGERLHKYVRHPVKAKFSNLHSRYFWLHPFTKTLFWSENKPEIGESKLKSMPIESYSIIQSTHEIPIIHIQSSNDRMKIQCGDRESFSRWNKVGKPYLNVI